MPLNDPTIRAALKEHLLNSFRKPRTIIDELQIHKGNAIADIVAIYKESHCFEIKGETDNINRLTKQGEFYNLTFNKITLVTTKNHLSNAIKKCPPFWGIIIAFEKNGKVKLKYHRKTTKNPEYDRRIALYTLWRQEMLDLSSNNKIELPKKLNKQEIALEISENLSNSAINLSIANLLWQRTFK